MTTIRDRVLRIVTGASRPDFHTHQYDPAMRRADGQPLLLCELHQLLRYHYLPAELFRVERQLTPAQYWRLSEEQQAEAVWSALFERRTPISEASQGVVSVLGALGIDAAGRSYQELLRRFPKWPADQWIDWAFARAKLEYLYMTNDPLDPDEGHNWLKGFKRDRRFRGVLRLDSALLDPAAAAPKLSKLGYQVSGSLGTSTQAEYGRYVREWTERIDAEYFAISLPPTFETGDGSAADVLLREQVFPIAAEMKRPVALMIGVRRGVNPALRDAGDSSGRCSVEALERLASEFPAVPIYITLLHRDNQHELCVAARKFSNIIPFGTWWFLNNPTLQHEMTAMRVEMLGTSFIPWHSDGRHLLHGVYKRAHFDQILVDVLAKKYSDLAQRGWTVSDESITKDLRAMTHGLMPDQISPVMPT